LQARALSFLFIIVFSISSLLACAKGSDGFFAAALGLDKVRILVASQPTTAQAVVAYDTDGKFLGVIADYQGENNGPRGLALLDSLHAIVSLEGDDRLDTLYLGGGRNSYIQSSFLTGTIGKLIRNFVSDELFIIEAGTAIERFTLDGIRKPQTGNSFVSGALAPCAAPASLRSLVVNNNGDLLAVQSGTTAAFRYTIGPNTASACATAAAVANVNDIINHSNGNLYYVTTTSLVVRASQTLTGSVTVFNNAASIGTPTALAELPGGNLIVASDATDTLEIIRVDGTYVGTFAKSIYTQTVHSILVVPGQ
jgi:hypothetical protein